MKEKDNSMKIGVQMFLAIGAFFLLTYAIGFGEITELRVVNIAIVVFFSNRLAKNNARKKSGGGYLHGLASLFKANVLSVLLSAIGFAVFVMLADPTYLEALYSSFLFGHEANVAQVCLGLTLEGLAGAAVVSFSVMQYWKNSKVVA